MFKIARPQIRVDIVFQDCISFIGNEEKRTRINLCSQRIVDDEYEYEEKMESKLIHTMEQVTQVNGNVTAKELSKIYTNHMVPENRARKYYDSIHLSSSLCPVCAHREVSEVDHYLPKQKYPTLAVVLLNLIPICPNCNRKKNDYVPTTSENTFIHPYFDVIEDQIWLNATIVNNNGQLSVQFFVNRPELWDDTMFDRVKYHFDFFKLSKLYATQAARKLSGIRKELTRMSDSGVDVVRIREYLKSGERSTSDIGINYWECVFFRTLAENIWFCEGGFRFE